MSALDPFIGGSQEVLGIIVQMVQEKVSIAHHCWDYQPDEGRLGYEETSPLAGVRVGLNEHLTGREMFICTVVSQSLENNGLDDGNIIDL